MARTYFISTDKVNTYGYIHKNVEQDVIQETIWRIQESKLQPILGTPLFRKLKEKIDGWENGDPKTGDYYTLMTDYIAPALIPMVEIKITYHQTYKIQNKTVGANNDEFMRSNTNSENNDLRDEIERDATHFVNELINHLCDDKGVKYPEYKESKTGKEGFNPEQSGPDYLNSISIV